MKIKLFVLLVVLMIIFKETCQKSLWCKLKLKKCPKPPPPPPAAPIPKPEDIEEARKKIEIKTHDSIINGVRDEAIKQAKNLTSLNKDVEFNAPYLIKRNYSHKELVNYSQKWNWNDEYDTILEIETSLNEHLANNFNKTLDESVELAVQSKLTNEITNEKVKSIASVIISNVPRRCEINENMNKVETIFYELCKSNQKFETDQLKIKLKAFVNNYGSSNTTLEESEIEELSVLVISTNEELEKILNRIDGEARENIISNMRNFVVSVIKTKQSSYENIMEQINNKIDYMYRIQTNELNLRSSIGNSIRLSYIIREVSNNPFTFTITQIIGNRADSDFFEFIPMSRLNPDNLIDSKSEGKINVSSISISGIAPTQNVEYDYSLTLAYTYLKDGSKTLISIKVTIVFCSQFDQCEPIPTPQENPWKFKHKWLIIVIAVLIFAAIIIIILVRNKLKSTNIQDQNGQNVDDCEMDHVVRSPYAYNLIFPLV